MPLWESTVALAVQHNLVFCNDNVSLLDGHWLVMSPVLKNLGLEDFFVGVSKYSEEKKKKL